ncbi:MAG: 50S ribosomal protein L6, partial [Leptospiraceae bacterium]|nr:50S ribosomal protein L6 [Leptospiraceae bacterium]
MSRVGNAAITVPGGVEIKVQDKAILVKGPLGEMKSPLPEGVELNQDGNVVQLKRTDDSREARALHGTARALLNNNIIGVSKGWVKNMELVGVGYRAQLKGNELVFSLGYSHEVRYPLPNGIKASVNNQTQLELNAVDRQKLGQVAAEIRSL